MLVLELDAMTRWEFKSSPLEKWQSFYVCSSVDCCKDIFHSPNSYFPPALQVPLQLVRVLWAVLANELCSEIVFVTSRPKHLEAAV